MNRLYPMPSTDSTISEIPIIQPDDAKPSMSTEIYNTAKLALGEHLTLNATVPPDVGCAEAVSFILAYTKIAGLPIKGFEGTADLWEWLKTAATAVEIPEAGDIVISPTGTSTEPILNPHGHCGIVLHHGIGSNDSNTGLFMENYTVQDWEKIFTSKGYPTYYYRF